MSLRSVFPPRASVLLCASAWSFSLQDPSLEYSRGPTPLAAQTGRKSPTPRRGEPRRIAEGKAGMTLRFGMSLRSVFPPRASVFLGASAWSFSLRDPSLGYSRGPTPFAAQTGRKSPTPRRGELMRIAEGKAGMGLRVWYEPAFCLCSANLCPPRCLRVELFASGSEPGVFAGSDSPCRADRTKKPNAEARRTEEDRGGKSRDDPAVWDEPAFCLSSASLGLPRCLRVELFASGSEPGVFAGSDSPCRADRTKKPNAEARRTEEDRGGKSRNDPAVWDEPAFCLSSASLCLPRCLRVELFASGSEPGVFAESDQVFKFPRWLPCAQPLPGPLPRWA